MENLTVLLAGLIRETASRGGKTSRCRKLNPGAAARVKRYPLTRLLHYNGDYPPGISLGG